MFSCTRHETVAIRQGRSTGAVRRYLGECPHKPSSMIKLSSKYVDGANGREIVFATATVVSVRPGTVGQFRKDKALAEKDGFESGPAWYTHLKRFLYKDARDGEKVYHVSFKIEEDHLKQKKVDL